MEFGTEEQQAEAVKDWWVNNRVPVIAGLVIGIVLMIAWSGYKSWSKSQSENNAALYAGISEEIVAKHDSAYADAEKYISENKGNVYGALGALSLASNYVLDSKYDKAETMLRIAADFSDPALSNTAKIRLARVQIQQKKYDDAEKTLSNVKSPVYQPMAEEVRGDMLVAQQKLKEAHAAYSKAAELSGASLEMTPQLSSKLNDLTIAE